MSQRLLAASALLIKQRAVGGQGAGVQGSTVAKGLAA